jgi:hypothetical protein
MPILVKESHGNEDLYFQTTALNIVIFVAQLNGWNISHDLPESFDAEDSKHLCETLEKTLPDLEEDISYLKENLGNLCDNCFFDLLVKEHQVELIEEFLEFCQGQPFRIDFED